MDLEKVKAQIAVLKDKAIDNVDKHFNEYYIDDILDAREYDLINNPINDFNWYWICNKKLDARLSYAANF